MYITTVPSRSLTVRSKLILEKRPWAPSLLCNIVAVYIYIDSRCLSHNLITGTLVVVYHMKLLDNGEPELDVFSDDTDILMGGVNAQDITYDNG